MPGLVLVVDDEEAIRELCRVNLELQGFDVVEAADGVAALEAVRTHRPDMVLLDVMMPRKDGWQTLAELKADEATAGVPVVMMTARRSESDQIAAWESGILDYVAKPFDPRALVEAATRAMEPVDAERAREHRRRVIEELARVNERRRRNADLRGG